MVSVPIGPLLLAVIFGIYLGVTFVMRAASRRRSRPRFSNSVADGRLEIFAALLREMEHEAPRVSRSEKFEGLGLTWQIGAIRVIFAIDPKSQQGCAEGNFCTETVINGEMFDYM